MPDVPILDPLHLLEVRPLCDFPGVGKIIVKFD